MSTSTGQGSREARLRWAYEEAQRIERHWTEQLQNQQQRIATVLAANGILLGLLGSVPDGTTFTGNDVIDGGPGEDLLSYDWPGSPAIVIDVAKGVATGQGSDTLSGIEDASGSPGDDAIAGDAGPNELRGYGGDDTLDGRQGFDSLRGGNGIDTCLNGEVEHSCEAAPIRSGRRSRT